MRKQFVVFLAVIFSLTVLYSQKSYAVDNTDDSSAPLTQTSTPVVRQPVDNRAKILQDYLQANNSPLAPYAQTFITEADRNNIPWELLPAISGVESNFGVNIPPDSYNGWGFGIYGNNVLRFASWDDGITQVSYSLRTVYMNQDNAQNVYQIGYLYASDPIWADKVTNYISQIDAFAQTDIPKSSLSISL